ncbi:MAG: hypothetical protein J1F35_06610 [Erysipelotrichales bacterium]|nr:hypothetical protein [Erysipelotrichales bacterium]
MKKANYWISVEEWIVACKNVENRINNSKDLYPIRDRFKTIIQSLFECYLIEELSKTRPSLYHPDDNSGMADIACRLTGNSTEVKCCIQKSAQFSNGSYQTSTENFIFILFDREEYDKTFKIKIKTIWYGTFSYNKWKYRINNAGDPTSMWICERDLNRYSTKIYNIEEINIAA